MAKAPGVEARTAEVERELDRFLFGLVKRGVRIADATDADLAALSKESREVLTKMGAFVMTTDVLRRKADTEDEWAEEVLRREASMDQALREIIRQAVIRNRGT